MYKPTPEFREKDNARRKTPEYRERERLRRHTDPVPNMVARVKARAPAYGHAFSIDESYVRSIWPTDNRCPVFGVEFVPGTVYGPSLDRIDNTMGYVAGNVQVISQRANRLKSDGTLAEHEAIVRHMRGFA